MDTYVDILSYLERFTLLYLCYVDFLSIFVRLMYF